MSLTTTSLTDTVKKQYFHKLKANIDSFSSLVGIQILAILFSFAGVGSSGIGGMEYSVNVKYYSSDIVFIFTIIWSFVTAITITTKPYRNHDFSFVSNRLSSSLSNMLFLVTTSILGGFTVMLSSNTIQLLSHLFFDEQLYYLSTTQLHHFILGFIVSFLYLFLVSSIGYFIGTMIQVNKLFVVLFPILFIGLLFFEGNAFRQPILSNVFQFFVMESTLFFFVIKTLITTAVLFFAAISVLNRLEVRR
ncbi:hypothetical protein GNT69_10865 [Bacillus sp. B15-48]|nr:hypothetical protein [Bacillus sp. B15-48]